MKPGALIRPFTWSITPFLLSGLWRCPGTARDDGGGRCGNRVHINRCGTNGRAITARIIIEVTVKVIRVQKIQVVTNISGVPGLEVEKELVRVQEVLGDSKSQESSGRL